MALDDRGSQFALLADHLPFVVARFDRQRRHLFVSKAAASATERPLEDLLGKSNEELGMPAALVVQWNAAIDTALAGTPTELTFGWDAADGHHAFEAKVIPEPMADGRIETVLCIARDVTNEVATRRELASAADERLRRLELERERLAAMFAESSAAVSVLRGPELTLELLNPRARELWGRSDEILGQPLLVALPELRGQGFEELLRGVVATGDVYRGEEVPVRIDRDRTGVLYTHYFDFVYAPLRARDGTVDGVIVHAHDVTEKVHARERMQLAIQTTGVGIWEWNVVTGEVRWDRQMCAIYGLPYPGPVTYETWRTAVVPEDLPQQEAILHETVRRVGQSAREFRIQRADDGRIRDIACVESVRLGATGRPEWVVGTNLDVTERRQSEQALRESEARFRTTAEDLRRLTAELSEADRRKDEFLATLAHELRNPLAPIRYGLAALRASPPPESTARTFDIMERQLGHLVRLVDDLLDISRVRSGKITLAKELVGARELVEVAIEACRPAIDARAHALEVDMVAEPLLVNGDRTRLVQVISNLVTNAVKYSEPASRIEVVVTREAEQAVIRVVDQGVGIPPEAISTLWDMFTQVRDTLEKAQGGLGIGLALARKLVDLHGGTISATSPGIGQGSTFEVRLPLALGGSVVVAAAAIPAPENHSVAKRILIVDDNIDGAETLAMLLEAAGHETHMAHDGPAALAAVRTLAPQVVFLDIGLPGMDGYEVARQVRADPDRASTVLVALTGWGTAADQARSRDAGFDAHLTKPIQLAVIQNVLARFSPG